MRGEEIPVKMTLTLAVANFTVIAHCHKCSQKNKKLCDVEVECEQ